jgi:hypothetical protein
VTLYVAAASDAAQFADARTGETKRSPFHDLLALAGNLITKAEAREARAMTARSRVQVVKSCSDVTSHYAWHTARKARVAARFADKGFTQGAQGSGGQTRLSFAAARVEQKAE